MRRPALLPPALLALGALAACAEFPEIAARIPAGERSAAPPALVALGPVLAAADRAILDTRATEAAVAEVETRVARLRARAAGLRGPVIDRATRARMQTGVRGAGSLR